MGFIKINYWCGAMCYIANSENILSVERDRNVVKISLSYSAIYKEIECLSAEEAIQVIDCIFDQLKGKQNAE